MLEASVPMIRPSGRPATDTVTVSDAMLNTTRCGGLRSPARRVHWAHALTAAMHVVSAGPSANSAQKFTACESDRFDWLRPSGSSIFAVDVATARPSSTANRPGCSRCRCSAADARQPAPATTTATTYARAGAGSERNVVDMPDFRAFIALSLPAGTARARV